MLSGGGMMLTQFTPPVNMGDILSVGISTKNMLKSYMFLMLTEVSLNLESIHTVVKRP